MDGLTGRQWYAIVLCTLAVFFDGYDAQMLAMAIPLMATDFGVEPTAFRYAGSASLLGMAVGALLLAPLADRHGRRRLLRLALALFGVPTLLAMAASTPQQITALRFIAGCGLGLAVPVTIAIVAGMAPAARRVQVVTLMASGFAVGASSAGLIAPVLTAAGGWHWLFAYGGLAPLLLLVFVWTGVPESRAETAVVGAAAPTLQPSVRTLFLPALRARTSLLWALNAINLFANYGLATWLPTLLIQNGWEPAQAFRVMAVLSIGALAGSYTASRLADQGRIALGLAGAYAVATVALAVCATNPGPGWVWVLLLVLIGFGAIGSMLTLGPLASAYYPEALRGTGVGWANGVGRFGSLFGPLALAALMDLQLPPTWVIGALMLPMFCCVGIALWLPRALRPLPGDTGGTPA
ncbi:MAG: hypothetical protein RL026_2482 [Pseudomonadota bacterium]|jgi:MFS family permease